MQQVKGWTIRSCNPDPDATNNQIADADYVHAARPRTLDDYNRPDQYYTNKFAIRPPAIHRNDFELKPQYFTFLGQTPFHGHPHEHPMNH